MSAASIAALPAPLRPTDDDWAKMLAAHVHLGTKNLDNKMIPYIWKRRADGLYVINLAKTWEKLMLAARIIVAIENPADGVCCALPIPGRSVVWARGMSRCRSGGRVQELVKRGSGTTGLRVKWGWSGLSCLTVKLGRGRLGSDLCRVS